MNVCRLNFFENSWQILLNCLIMFCCLAYILAQLTFKCRSYAAKISFVNNISRPLRFDWLKHFDIDEHFWAAAADSSGQREPFVSALMDGYRLLKFTIIHSLYSLYLQLAPGAPDGQSATCRKTLHCCNIGPLRESLLKNRTSAHPSLGIWYANLH